MARQVFKIEGLSELDEALSELPKATARNVLKRVLTEQGQHIKDAGESLAPKLKGGLKASYTVSQKLSKRQKSQNRKESDVEVYIGPGPAAKGVQTEFGNAHQAAQPHLRPAFDGNVQKVLIGIRDSLAEQIDKAVQRLNKKAERLAAKIAAGK